MASQDEIFEKVSATQQHYWRSHYLSEATKLQLPPECEASKLQASLESPGNDLPSIPHPKLDSSKPSGSWSALPLQSDQLGESA